jgi:predicted transcriptional regulator
LRGSIRWAAAMPDRAMLLSLRQRHASAILAGQKRVEVRRRPVAAPVGTTIVLYATSPVQAIVGTARLAAKLRCSAEEAWEIAWPDLALERDELTDYLLGSAASLLWLDDVRPLARAIALAELRAGAPFRPPQSYRYVRAADPRALVELTTTRAPRDHVPGPHRSQVAGRLRVSVAQVPG